MNQKTETEIILYYLNNLLKPPMTSDFETSGDLGGPAYRKFDLEAWMPGRGDGGEYGEITSTSNCTDFQSRRLNARYKVKGAQGTHFLHTLNGTAIAISRALVAILELYQQPDGSVRVPKVLQTIVGKEVISR